jgi:hypothetical protein
LPGFFKGGMGQQRVIDLHILGSWKQKCHVH